ncbi:MAG: hypothetical protein IPG78_03475 [Ignavibacteria bacterium]|nr:hypothetical protein [Ignavibacteria bacterium]
MKSINDPEIIDWIDYMSDKLDKYEIYRNEYLAEFDQAPRNLRFYEDVLMPFCENTLIMDNIASSENLCFENGKINNKLKIECYINGNRMTCKYPAMSFIIPHSNCNGEISYPDNFPYLMKHKDFGNDINKNKFILKSAFAQRQITKRENDIEITLHSEQAFYSILENVIRNSAKHNKDECAKKGLTIFIDIRESEDKNNYELTIYDNVSELKGSLLFGDKKNQGIYQRLNESLLDESGGVRRENWGFADIRINSFLFFNRGDEITNENMASNIDLVKVIELKTGVGCDYNSSEILSPSFEIINNQKSIENDKVYSFGYQMKISKAKKILWVGDLIKKWNIEEFRKNGFVQIRDLKELDNKEKSMQNGGISAFDFVIFNRKLTEADLEENVNMKRKKPNYEVKLPGRILCINKDERIIKPNIIEIDLNCFDKINDVNSILEVCWKQWLKALEKNIKLYIYYEDESFNDSWKNNLLDEFLEFKVVKKDQNVNICEKDFNIILENHGNAKIRML